MDSIDVKILSLLQEDAGLTVAQLAERVRLSATPCWRRVQKLEADGVIRRRVTLLDAKKLGVGVTAFVRVKTSNHSMEWFARFARAVAAIPEIVEFHRMSGDIDYLLKIMVPDIAGYDAVYKRLISSVDLEDVSSSFALEEIKSTTAVPLAYALKAARP